MAVDTILLIVTIGEYTLDARTIAPVSYVNTNPSQKKKIYINIDPCISSPNRWSRTEKVDINSYLMIIIHLITNQYLTKFSFVNLGAASVEVCEIRESYAYI